LIVFGSNGIVKRVVDIGNIRLLGCWYRSLLLIGISYRWFNRNMRCINRNRVYGPEIEEIIDHVYSIV